MAARATADGEALKVKALGAVLDRNLDEARSLCEEARQCFVWATGEGSAVRDVELAIAMAVDFWKGCEALEEAKVMLARDVRAVTQ